MPRNLPFDSFSAIFLFESSFCAPKEFRSTGSMQNLSRDYVHVVGEMAGYVATKRELTLGNNSVSLGYFNMLYFYDTT